MKNKLILVDVRENNKAKGTRVTVYNEAYDILKDLSERTGQPLSLIASKMIEFAHDYIEIDSKKV